MFNQESVIDMIFLSKNLKVAHFKKIFCLFSFFFLAYCRPEASTTKDSSKSMTALSSSQQTGALEAKCSKDMLQGKREAILAGLVDGTLEFFNSVKTYLDTNTSCSSSNMYQTFLASEPAPSSDPLPSSAGSLYDTSGLYGDPSLAGADDPFATDPNTLPSSTLGSTVTPTLGGLGGTGSVIYYLDVDADGFGSNDVYPYKPPSNYTLIGGTDCDDLDPLVNPDSLEDCMNLIDDDCDGEVDEMKYFTDKDLDTYGTNLETTPKVWATCLYSPSKGIDKLAESMSSFNNLDCDDNNISLQLMKNWHIDQDRDGFGYGGALIAAGVDVVAIKRCTSDTRTSLEIGASYYVDNPNDCFDDPLQQIAGSEIGADPDCDGFLAGNDCEPLVLSTLPHSNDQDCDARPDFDSTGAQTDFCITKDGYGLHSSGSTIVTMDTLETTDYWAKTELHKCGHDYDLDGCWDYDSSTCFGDPNFPTVRSRHSEDCADGDSSLGLYSRVEGSKYLYTHYLQEFSSGGVDDDTCSVFEFINPLADPNRRSTYEAYLSSLHTADVATKPEIDTNTYYHGDYFRVQSQYESDESWYDLCTSFTDSADLIIHNNADLIENCEDSDEKNYYFQVFSRTNTSSTWEEDDQLSLKPGRGLTLDGSTATWNKRDEYISTAYGAYALVPHMDEFWQEKDETIYAHVLKSFDTGTEMSLNSAGVYTDKSDNVYPIVSNSFILRSKNDGVNFRWGISRGLWGMIYTSLDADIANLRLVKMLCLKDPPDPDVDDVEKIYEAFEDGDLKLSATNCSHSNPQAASTE